MDVKAAFSRSDLFRGVSDAELDRIVPLARSVAFEDGKLIVAEDEEAKDLFLIVEGRGTVEVRWPYPDEDGGGLSFQQIGAIKRGDIIGEVTLVDRHLRSATVRAQGKVEAIALPNEALRRLLEESPLLGYRVMENLARYLASRIRAANLKLRNTIANLLY
jgi:CRP-like cAMP-binding protein